MLRHTNPLYIITYLILILASPVISHAGTAQVAYGIRPSTYKVNCDPQALSAGNAFKLQCQNLIQKRVIGAPGPFSGTGKWKEEIWTSTNSIWTTSSPLCAISFSARRPMSPQTWSAVKDGVKAIAHECVDKKGLGGIRTKVATRRQIQHEPPVVWITRPYHSPHAIPIPPPTGSPEHTPEHTSPGTCWQLLASSSQTLTEPEKKIRTCCYQLMGATGALAAGLYTGISNPLLGGGFALGGMVLVHKAMGNLNGGLQRSAPHDKRKRSQEGERMLGLAPNSHISQSSPQSSPRLPISYPPPSAPPSFPPSSPHGFQYSSSQVGRIDPFEISSPPTEAETRRICTLIRSLGRRTAEELRRIFTLTAEQQKMLDKACCKSVGGLCLTTAGGLIGHYTSEKAAAPLYVAGVLVASSGAQDLHKAFKGQSAPYGTDVIVKRRRSIDCDACEGPVHSPSSSRLGTISSNSAVLYGSPREKSPVSAVKHRRSQEGGRMVGLSSPPNLHRPPSPPSAASPSSSSQPRPSGSSQPRSSSSPQARPNNRLEFSSPQRQAELRRICTRLEGLTEEERYKMRQICCKMLAGGCLLTAGGGVVAWTNTLAGIPFALAGAVVSLSSIKDLHDAKFFQPPAPRGPAGPAGPEGPANNVRRRGRLVRRKDDKKKKPEDKRKGLEAGGDAGHSGDESDGGIEMEGDDGGGDGGE